MWRYMNVSKPNEGAKRNRAENDREYEEEKRSRSYRKEWEQNHKWLRYDEEKGEMFCHICRETGIVGEPGKKSNAFFHGSTSFRLNSVKKHGESENHRKGVSIMNARKAEPGTSKAEKMIYHLNQKAVHRLQHLFRNAHAIARHCRPFTDFAWMCSLDRAKGLDIGTTYLNDRSAQVFVHFIAEVERRKMVERVQKSKFVSIISDGTTDSSVTEDEIIYIRHSCDGTIHMDFVAVAGVTTADAVSIKDATLHALKEKLAMEEEDVSRKLVGFGSDGAAVMLGRTGGVSALLKQLNPELQAVHCSAHRLELAFKDAMKRVNLCNTVNTLFLNLYLFYKNSSKNRSSLKVAAEAHGDHSAIPTRVGGTRWLPHLERAMRNFLRGYRAMITHLYQVQAMERCTGEAKAKAKGFQKLLERKDVLMYILFLYDVVTVLSKVSLVAQKSTSTVAEVAASIEAATSTIRMYNERKSTPHMLEFNEHFQGELKGEPDIEHGLTQLLDGLEGSLQGRFQDINEGVCDALKIASFNFWPEDIGEFGNEEVRTLARHFKQSLTAGGVDTTKLSVEWDLFKARVCSDKKRGKTWSHVIQGLKEELPNICHLLDLVLTIPASSAEAERGFSRLKLLKTNLRSSLRDDRVTDQLLIMLHGSDEEHFDPMPAISLWNSGAQRARRPDKSGDDGDAQYDLDSDSSGDEAAGVMDVDSDF